MILVQDPDLTIHVGDVREVLAGLPDGSVDCVVTSPPYWGLRDYGTGQWEGGNPDCDHKAALKQARKFTNGRGEGRDDEYAGSNLTSWTTRDATVKDGGCPKGCGARRVDQQLGLEPTPDLYVQNMVAVFREVRRVLADHGTCWVNLGDSYASIGSGPQGDSPAARPKNRVQRENDKRRSTLADGLKPKDLVGIPWRVAFALQANGWYLRADIIWAKPNPMPESVTDRPTKAHEYVFLLSKRPRYWFDQEAVREPADRAGETIKGDRAPGGLVNGGWLKGGIVAAGRNVRSVWEIATQPYAEAHFATYPEELVRRCLLAGCPEWVCGVCGKPRERIVEPDPAYAAGVEYARQLRRSGRRSEAADDFTNVNHGSLGPGAPRSKTVQTVGWSDCGHDAYRPGVVLDPFGGSGTTAVVARAHGRHAVLVELNPEYAQLAAGRLSQLSLLAELG